MPHGANQIDHYISVLFLWRLIVTHSIRLDDGEIERYHPLTLRSSSTRRLSRHSSLISGDDRTNQSESSIETWLYGAVAEQIVHRLMFVIGQHYPWEIVYSLWASWTCTFSQLQSDINRRRLWIIVMWLTCGWQSPISSIKSSGAYKLHP